jgi:hypothetical protein
MLINSPNISGSLKVTGNTVITGSLTVVGGINATIQGTAATASYVQYTSVANKPTLVSGSSQISYSGISNKPSGIVSSSVQVRGYNVFATTGSNQFKNSQAITGSLTVTGTLIAQKLNVQQVTSSIVYSSGSNRFGNTLGNTQQFTGSVSITGSLTTSIATLGTTATTFLTSNNGTIKSRTAAQTLSDIAALPLSGGTVTGLTTFYNASSYSDQAKFGGGANNRYLYTYVDNFGVGLSTGTGFGGESIYFNPVSNYIDFSIASSSKMRLVTGGGLEIGYNSIQNIYKLDVNGTARVSGAATFSSSVTAGKIISSASLDTEADLAVFTNTSSGTSAIATIFVRNAASVDSSTFISTLGTGYTTTGGFIQDSGVIGTGTEISGGLSIMTRANANMRFYTNGHTNERMRITSGGDVFINNSSGVTLNDLTNKLSVSSTSYNLFDISRFSNNAFGPNFYLVKSRNGSIGGNTIVANGDNLGNISWLGANGTGFTDAASIKAEVDGTPGASDMPGRLVFSTTADGTTNNTERMRITSGGFVGIGTTSPTAKLEIQNSPANDWGLSVWGNTTTGQSYGGIVRGGTNSSDVAFRVNNAANSLVYFTVQGNGNVGIGTNDPQAKLEIKSGYLRMFDPSSGLNAGYAIEWSSNNGGTNVSYANIDAITTSAGNRTGDLLFRTSNAGSPSERMRITSTGTIQPGANGTQDLGTTSLRWATVYTSDLSLSNGIGDYTIVEGENDLFLYNNKQNKVYKFVIEEVDPSTATPKKS